MKAKTYSEMKLQYKKIMEVGLIVSLLFHVVLFQGSKRFVVGERLVEMDIPVLTALDIPQTVHKQDKVAVSRPAIPIPTDDPEILGPEPEDVWGGFVNFKLTPHEFSGEEEDPFKFVPVEQYPEPIGGVAAIQAKVTYPKPAIAAGIEGIVLIRAKIDEQGNVVSMLVQNSMDFEPCEQEAMQAIQAVKFTPAMQRDEPVAVWMSIPVEFRLSVK